MPKECIVTVIFQEEQGMDTTQDNACLHVQQTEMHG